MSSVGAYEQFGKYFGSVVGDFQPAGQPLGDLLIFICGLDDGTVDFMRPHGVLGCSALSRHTAKRRSAYCWRTPSSFESHDQVDPVRVCAHTNL